ncbi:hypothetical protein [Thiohalophilus sp.]|uniref:hypothetical protein n=1 Tax=Thiohalophilus sp. TaxID=3028392 RepID=UPI002ACF0784|nr:hypothetical protein [Thiohalophilus sp.]MDZ7663006.1 hypothetical protein [Thiohalophilus sp.]
MSHSEIQEVIKKYAKAYSEFQDWQDSHPAIPGGDQKTGCIGEYYAYIYLLYSYPDAELKYGTHSEKGWDIELTNGISKTRIQVKTVSQFSKTRTISPIHKGWDVLYLLYLNKELYPIGFWIIEDAEIFGEREKLTSRKCPIPGKLNTGSKDIPFGENLIEPLENAISSF